MARKRKTRNRFQGSPCKTNCGGHLAGYRYARSGGRTPSPSSRSFNRGMGIFLGTFNPRSLARKRNRR